MSAAAGPALAGARAAGREGRAARPATPARGGSALVNEHSVSFLSALTPPPLPPSYSSPYHSPYCTLPPPAPPPLPPSFSSPYHSPYCTLPPPAPPPPPPPLFSLPITLLYCCCTRGNDDVLWADLRRMHLEAPRRRSVQAGLARRRARGLARKTSHIRRAAHSSARTPRRVSKSVDAVRAASARVLPRRVVGDGSLAHKGRGAARAPPTRSAARR
jgi:hypothetical protein